MSGPDDGISGRTRLMMFLYSNRNLAGAFMALAGLGAHFAGFLVPSQGLPERREVQEPYMHAGQVYGEANPRTGGLLDTD